MESVLTKESGARDKVKQSELGVSLSPWQSEPSSQSCDTSEDSYAALLQIRVHL